MIQTVLKRQSNPHPRSNPVPRFIPMIYSPRHILLIIAIVLTVLCAVPNWAIPLWIPVLLIGIACLLP